MKARRRRHSKMSFLRKSCVQILTLRKKFFCIFYFFMRVLKESKKKKPCCCKAFKKWEVRFSIKLFKKRTSFIWSEWWGSNPRASRSQTARSINWTTPGYSVFLHDTMRRRKKQVFRVCGRRCGQARFCRIFSTGEFSPQATVPRASGLSLLGEWMSRLSSQSKRATNCATPGYEVFQLWSNMGSAPVFDLFF